MFIDYITLMLINMVAGLFLLAYLNAARRLPLYRKVSGEMNRRQL